MAETFHRNPDARALQTIGATQRLGEDFAWFFGENHDYLLEFEGGKVVAEVTRRASPLGGKDDTLYSVTYVSENMLVTKTDGSMAVNSPLQEFYMSRSAARDAVEAHYGAAAAAPSALQLS